MDSRGRVGARPYGEAHSGRDNGSVTADPIRVLIADDHPVVRGGLVALLATLDGIEVVGEAADGAAVVREAVILRPDVVVLDLRMPGQDGIHAARDLAQAIPGTAVLVLSMFDDDDLVTDAIAAGARGYLLKGAEPHEIEHAIRLVASGVAVFAPQVVPAVLGTARRRTAAEPFPDLTAREREVLDRIARGLSNGEIAGGLQIATKTVSNHVSAIFWKLGVSTRAEAIVRARGEGLGS